MQPGDLLEPLQPSRALWVMSYSTWLVQSLQRIPDGQGCLPLGPAQLWQEVGERADELDVVCPCKQDMLMVGHICVT